MRGRTLSNAFVIVDEAQNATIPQMKMVLTRLGEGSHMVVTGDPSQVDLPRIEQSGLAHAIGILEHLPRVEVIRFASQDVVRHRLVAHIIEAYHRDEGGRG
jgi:phosphate starvation-inducible PhoH-like protein